MSASDRKLFNCSPYPFSSRVQQKYFRRDIVLPGDLFSDTSDWSEQERRREEEEKGEEVEDSEPGVMLRW